MKTKQRRWEKENRERMPRKKKRSVPTGYKLHAMRLAYSGGEAMRTIKYPLVPHSDKARPAFDGFINKVCADSVAMMGDLQFSDWLRNEKEESHPYSLADFYLDSLRAGIIFAPDAGRSMQDLIASLGGGTSDRRKAFDEALAQKDAEFIKYIDADGFYKFCFSDARAKPEKAFITDTPDSILGQHLPVFRSWNASGKSQKLFEAEKFLNACFPQTSKYPFRAALAPLVFDENMSAVELVERHEKYARKVPWYMQYGKNEKGRRERIFGITNRSSALQGYFNGTITVLRKGGAEFLESNKALPVWQGKERDLEQRVKFLVSRAQMLPSPACGNSWADYRSVFGSGRIGSWLSNLTRQKKEVKDQLLGGLKRVENGPKKGELQPYGHKQNLEKIKDDEILLQHDPESREIVNLLLKFITEIEKAENIDTNVLVLYQDQLGALRSILNEAYQIKFPEVEGENETERKRWRKEHRASEKYKELHKNIKLIPQFPGDAKRVKYKKLILAPRQVKAATAYIHEVANLLEGTLDTTSVRDDKLLKLLESLRRKSFALNGTRAQHIIRTVLGKFEFKAEDEVTNLETFLHKDQEKNYYFFRPVYARSRFGRRIVVTSNYDASDELVRIAAALAPRWDDLIEQGDVAELLDACELEKIRIGILAEYAEDSDYDLGLEQLPKKMFEKAHAFQRIIGKRPATRGEYGRFLQTTVLSELKGALTKMSRKKYIERYVVQVIGSDKSYPIVRHGHQWGISLQKKSKEAGGTIKVSQKGKEFTNDAFIETRQDTTRLLDIHSSKYQIQFLDKALGGEKSWWNTKHGIDITNGEYSFIVEGPMSITWNLEKETVCVEEDKKDAQGTRLFVSVPFSLKPKKKKSHLALGERTRYMGIDVGEFGLAWTVLELRDGAPHVLAHDFIHERLTRNIRDFVQTLKTRQSLGTFGMPSTKLERLRENAITSLRNRVHAIAMRYDAIPVYEKEIDAFESGGNRVKGIYMSVKRADVGRGSGKTAAENLEVDLVWGSRTKQIGKQVSAYATSHICSKCGYSVYDNYSFKNPKTEPLSELKKREKRDGERPPLKILIKDGAINELDLQQQDWVNKYGNSAIYKCAEADCKHLSHADMQASYWIALRGALYGKSEDVEDEDTVKKKTKVIGIKELREAHKKNPTVITLKPGGEVEYGPA